MGWVGLGWGRGGGGRLQAHQLAADDEDAQRTARLHLGPLPQPVPGQLPCGTGTRAAHGSGCTKSLSDCKVPIFDFCG